MGRARGQGTGTDLDTLMSGPCWFCRRPMNWIAADDRCWQMCRWCLSYFTEALYWAPEYGVLLVSRGNYHARRRGDHQIIVRERMN